MVISLVAHNSTKAVSQSKTKRLRTMPAIQAKVKDLLEKLASFDYCVDYWVKAGMVGETVGMGCSRATTSNQISFTNRLDR